MRAAGPWQRAMRPILLRLCAGLSLLAAAPVHAEPAPLRPALWKVTHHHTTIWLFGTIHMLPPDTHWIDGAIAKAADNATEIATEIDDPDGTRTRAAIAGRAGLPPGDHLADLLPIEERTALAERLGRFGIKPDSLDDRKPWFAAAMVSTLPLIRRGFDPHNGVEAGLYAREAPRHVHRVGIETPDGQIGVLDGLPLANQLAYLKTVIDQFDRIDGEVTAMFDAWSKGDAENLARLMNEDDGMDDPLLIDRLITQRNRTFAVWIAKRLKRPGRVFVAIGAGHLAGAGSVQDDLAKAGIKVERVQ